MTIMFPIAARSSMPRRSIKWNHFIAISTLTKTLFHIGHSPVNHPKGAYFTRGSGHNMYGAYTEDSNEYLEVVDRLRRKWETAKSYVPGPAIYFNENYRAAIVSVGSCDGAVLEARDRLQEAGVNINYMRVKAFPFDEQVEQFLGVHDRIYVVEQNRDAQLRSLLMLETEVDAAKLVPLLFYDGLPINARGIVESINKDQDKNKAKAKAKTKEEAA